MLSKILSNKPITLTEPENDWMTAHRANNLISAKFSSLFYFNSKCYKLRNSFIYYIIFIQLFIIELEDKMLTYLNL